MLRKRCTAAGNQPRRQPPRHVLLERKDRLGLRAIALEDHRQRFFHADERRVDDVGLDPARDRFGTHAREPFRKRGTWRVLRGDTGRPEGLRYRHDRGRPEGLRYRYNMAKWQDRRCD